MAQTRNTTDNKQDKSSFRTLSLYIWEWLKRNFWLVMAVLVLGVVLSAQQEVLTDLAKRQFVLLQRSPLGIPFLLAALGAVIAGIGARINERCKHQSTADPRSVFFALILLGLGLYVFIAFPFWQLHRWQTIVTTVTFYLIVLGSTALWLVLPGFYFNKNRQKYIEQKAKAADGHEESFLILDTPIGKDNEDLAVEPSYIGQLKYLIDSFPFDHTGTIAVTGAWGAGKTSHINVLESVLDKGQYLFVRFEPMKCERPELIQAAFFDQLEAALSPFRSGFPRYFRHYKELIGAVDNKYAQFVTTLFSISQEDARGRIQRGIQSLHRRIVVFIDDVDRLDRQELEQIFRLVGFNAKFNSLVFLLAMDKTRVEATMGATDNFSDKFAEVEFYLPRMNPNAIWNFVIEEIFDRLVESESARCKADKGLETYTKHCLPTMRDAKRFVNSFLVRFNAMNESKEYIFRDYFLLSLLHYADPNAFEVIAGKDAFDSQLIYGCYAISRHKFQNTKTETDDLLWHLVLELFPASGSQAVSSINKPDYFFLYFNEATAKSGFTIGKALSLLNMSTRSDIESKINEWSQAKGFKADLEKYYNEYDVRNLSEDDPRVGKYFIVCDILKIKELFFNEDLAEVEKGGKWGYIDKTGAVRIPFEYDDAYEFSEGLSTVKKGDKWGYIDRTGVVRIRFEYDDAYEFSKGLARVKKGENWGFVDYYGKLKIPFKYDAVYIEFSEGFAPVKKGNKFGYIDPTGAVKITFVYDAAWPFSEGLAPVQVDGKWGYIDKTGTMRIPIVYDEAWRFSENLAAVEKAGKWGFTDKTGAVKIPFEYENVRDFFDGLAAVRKGGKWGFVDKDGAVKIPFEYDFARSFSEGRAWVKKNLERFYINKEGKRV